MLALLKLLYGLIILIIYCNLSLTLIIDDHTTKTPTTTTTSDGEIQSDEKGKISNITEDAKYWYNVGFKQLQRNIQFANEFMETKYLRKAKNVIIFIGDGMGPSTVTAGRIYKGQYMNNGMAENGELAFDRFPNTGYSKTYNVNKQVADSASTATALFTGVKTIQNGVGVDATSRESIGNSGAVSSFMEWAQMEGKRTGIVTTTRITHATPAATYAKSFTRNWECDSKIPTKFRNQWKDIARQLVENEPGNRYNVIMGGGRGPMGRPDPNEKRTVFFSGKNEYSCEREDGLDLVESWLQMDTSDDYSLNNKDMQRNNSARVFVSNRYQLQNVQFKEIDYLMGLFKNNHLSYSLVRDDSEPSLQEMTEAAIDVLERQDSKGYVLMVEGGRIDHGHHQNYARAALREVYELDRAVEAAVRKTSSKDTLIIVTADHSHAVTLSGYADRGSDILGLAKSSSDNMPYETISYANGPGFMQHIKTSSEEINQNSDDSLPLNHPWKSLWKLTPEERRSPTYRHQSMVYLQEETHGGEEVGVYASGPSSNLIRGVFDQNYLAFVMSYASCIGPAKNFDDSCLAIEKESTSNSSTHIIIYKLLILVVSFNAFFR